MKIQIPQLRSYLMDHHCFYSGFSAEDLKSGQKAVQAVFKKIKTIQYDPLYVVGRNPDLVLQSRIRNYRPEYLATLLYKKRRIIDGWDKMMALYETDSWGAFQKMRLRRKGAMEWVLNHRGAGEALSVTEKCLSYLKENGPSLASAMDFGGVAKGSWGHGRLSSAALDYLFHKGDVGIYERKGTQRVFELISRLLPEKILTQKDPFNTDREFHSWLVLRRADSMGLIWEKSSAVWKYIDQEIDNTAYRKKIISELVDEGKLVEVQVKGIKDCLYIKRKEAGILEKQKDFDPDLKEIRFIAALDNLIWDRKLTELVFNFEYRWEVYTPVKKRKFGYYVLPVLYGDALIGRIEPVVDNENNHLLIKNLWLEQGVKFDRKLKQAFQRELKLFCSYLGLGKISNETDYKFSV